MLSKNQLKLISSLSSKKFRDKHEMFIVEGEKNIKEFLNSSYSLSELYTTEQIFTVDGIEISQRELDKISQLKSPNKAIALFKIPKVEKVIDTDLLVALDSIRDPGNLGTIIRLCDWFGIREIVCSKDTVDCYNPKVVQASMGSLARINIRYTDIKEFLLSNTFTVYGTTMDGNSIYDIEIKGNSILLFGNEANGISQEIKDNISNFVSIPRYNNNSSVESLNVATAAAICLSEVRRRYPQ